MRAFAESIVDSIRHPLLILDTGLNVVLANASFYEMFGGIPSTTKNRNLFEIDGGRWANPRLKSSLEVVFPQEGSFRNLEIETEIAGIGRRTLSLNAHKAARTDDATPMILLSIEDETEKWQARSKLTDLNRELQDRIADRTAQLEEANRELLNANRELAAANRELEAFCYSVSHDLRSPLRAVDGFSQELLQSYSHRLDEKGRHYLNRIRAGTQRMGNLIDDLLKLSKVTRAEMHLENVDLTSLAEAVISELREIEPHRNVSFTAQPGIKAECDLRLIRAVLENLLGNAWKFTAKVAEAKIEFDKIEREGRTAFRLQDNGSGFDMAYAGKLFGAFQRLHSDREFPGTGIGLATVQRIIRRHGGEIWAKGEVGRGAAFYFTIPSSEKKAVP